MVRRVRAAGTHAVARYSQAACVRSAHTLHGLQRERLPETTRAFMPAWQKSFGLAETLRFIFPIFPV